MRLAKEVPSLLIETVGVAELVDGLVKRLNGLGRLLDVLPGVLVGVLDAVLLVGLAVESLCDGLVDARPFNTALNVWVWALFAGVWLTGRPAIE